MAVVIPVAELRDVSILRGLHDPEIKALLEGAERKEFPAGAPIFNEGDEVTGLYMIEQGKVVVRKKVPGGGYKDLATLDAKHVFGEMGLLVGGRARTASVHAKEESVVWHLPRMRFAQLIEQGGAAVAKVTLNMARILAYRLDALNKELVRFVEAADTAQGKPTKKKTAELSAFKEKLDNEWSF